MTGRTDAELLADHVAGDADACRALATRHGMALWNAMPLPGNGFRPVPLPVVGGQRVILRPIPGRSSASCPTASGCR